MMMLIQNRTSAQIRTLVRNILIYAAGTVLAAIYIGESLR